MRIPTRRARASPGAPSPSPSRRLILVAWEKAAQVSHASSGNAATQNTYPAFPFPTGVHSSPSAFSLTLTSFPPSVRASSSGPSLRTAAVLPVASAITHFEFTHCNATCGYVVPRGAVSTTSHHAHPAQNFSRRCKHFTCVFSLI